jgi:polyisoprenyl-phosphate glycosyltransferase
MKISVIIPLYNEEANLTVLYSRLKQALSELVNDGAYEIIFINDGSKDKTRLIIQSLADKDESVVFINLSRNFGHQIAISAGIDICRGDAVVIMDGDLQDPPELIAELYSKFKEGYNVVYAQRAARHGEGWFKRKTAEWFYKTIKKITEIDIPLNTGDFRIIDKSVVKALRNMPEKDKFLRGQIAWLGFKQVNITYDRHPRNSGKSGFSLKKMINFAMDGVTSFSDWPLKMATFAGFVTSFISLFLIGYAIYSRFIGEEFVKGWTSLMISITFIGGVQLLCIGIIGEYIIRLINNIRNRPLYVVESTNVVEKNKEKEN